MKEQDVSEDVLKVLKYHSDELEGLQHQRSTVSSDMQDTISELEILLKALGKGDSELHYIESKAQANVTNMHTQKSKHTIYVSNWNAIVSEANQNIHGQVTWYDLFTPDELQQNTTWMQKLQEEFNGVHRLDAVDYCIPIVAGILSAIIDCVFIGIPNRTNAGTTAGTLPDSVRELFEKWFTPGEGANCEGAKVSFDAQDNRNTTVNVDGLSSYFHRLLSLGHDPILAFIVGVIDVMNGTMTTIDKSGRIVVQIMENYSSRNAENLFEALSKVFLHLKSDVTTSMGLPAPLMALFNLCQFGKIGKDEQTIAQIVQGMYYEGYDFIHFCACSIPVMILEVVVRISYAAKRLHEGYTLAESIPIGTNHQSRPKLGTELFIAHAIASSINAGKVLLTKNPLAINLAEWYRFVVVAFEHLKWVLIQKPDLQQVYMQGHLDGNWEKIMLELDNTWEDFQQDYEFVFEEELSAV